MPKHKASQLQISDHARQRWLERGGQGELIRSLVEPRLRVRLALGADVVEDAVRVPLDAIRDAVCEPCIDGGWICVTIKFRREESA